MSRIVTLSLLAIVLIGSTAALTALPFDVPEVPLAVTFADFPASLGSWRADPAGVPEDILPPDGRGVPDQLVRTYRDGAETVWVSVGYYPSLPEGRRPATQKLLYPNKGWADLTGRSVSLPLGPAAGSLPVNILVMRGESRRVAVLYWFQVGAHGFSSDHRYRAYLLYNRLIHRRSDMALIRIATRARDGIEPDAPQGALTRFVQAFHPELLRSLPR